MAMLACVARVANRVARQHCRTLPLAATAPVASTTTTLSALRWCTSMPHGFTQAEIEAGRADAVVDYGLSRKLPTRDELADAYKAMITGREHYIPEDDHNLLQGQEVSSAAYNQFHLMTQMLLYADYVVPMHQPAGAPSFSYVMERHDGDDALVATMHVLSHSDELEPFAQHFTQRADNLEAVDMQQWKGMDIVGPELVPLASHMGTAMAGGADAAADKKPQVGLVIDAHKAEESLVMPAWILDGLSSIAPSVEVVDHVATLRQVPLLNPSIPPSTLWKDQKVVRYAAERVCASNTMCCIAFTPADGEPRASGQGIGLAATPMPWRAPSSASEDAAAAGRMSITEAMDGDHIATLVFSHPFLAQRFLLYHGLPLMHNAGADGGNFKASIATMAPDLLWGLLAAPGAGRDAIRTEGAKPRSSITPELLFDPPVFADASPEDLKGRHYFHLLEENVSDEDARRLTRVKADHPTSSWLTGAIDDGLLSFSQAKVDDDAQE